MAYDRYDSRDQNRGDRDDRSRDDRGGNGRGFFERAREEVSSWFGDEDGNRGEGRGYNRAASSYDPNASERGGDYGSSRYSSSSSSYEPRAYDRDEGRGRTGRDDDRFGQSDRGALFGGGQSTSYGRGRDEGDYKNQYGRGGGESGGFGRGDYGSQNLGSNDRGASQNRSYPSGYGQTGGGSYRDTQHQSYGAQNHRDDDRQSRGYQSQGSDRQRPLTGDYGRGSEQQGRQGSGLGSQEFGREQYGRQDFSQDQNRDRQYNYGGWGDRDSKQQDSGSDYARSGLMGAGAGASSIGRGAHDDHYSSWRQRQIEELDRDYDEYRREHQSRFENEFTGFRQQRQTKRQMLGSIREHFEVVDESGQHIGTVDKVRGDKVILTKNDPEAHGVHRSFTCSLLERVEDNKVYLTGSKDSIRSRLTEERDEHMDRGQNQGGGILGSLFGSESNDRDDRRDQRPSMSSTNQPSGEGPHMLDKSFSGTYDDASKTDTTGTSGTTPTSTTGSTTGSSSTKR